MKYQTKIVMMSSKHLLAAAAAGLITAGANATLVAYFPLDEGVVGTTANTIDDIIDDGSHGVTDGTANNSDATWVNDPTRGTVLSTVNGNRFAAGTQDIDLSVGFTWSLWVKSDSVANRSINDGGTDPNGADVIIGSRNGTWNKVQPTGTARYFDLGGYNIDDDTWHHIAYTADAATGGAFYVDGVSVATDASPFNNLQSINDVMEIGGSSRFTEDWAGLMSDIAIWDERLDDSRIAALAAGGRVIQIPNLSLQVDRATGATTILGVSEEAWEINFYQITSEADSLDATGWNSLADQDYEGNGPANGTGNGWEEAGGSNAGDLAEGYLLDNSAIGIDAEVSLGNAYDTSVDAQDLVFLYRSKLGIIFEGSVEYVINSLPGDTDGDGDVDDSDLGTAFSNYTGPVGDVGKTAADGDVDGDGDVDDSDLGTSFSNYTGPIAVNVPEPASAVLLALAGAALSRRRRSA